MWYPFRSALKQTYDTVLWLGASSEGDAHRWAHLGVREESVEVTGDTRHDQVLERASKLHRLRSLLRWSVEDPALVAGSTDARDERHLLNAFSGIVASYPKARLVIAPHECSDRRINEVLTMAQRTGVSAEVWPGGPPSEETRCLVVSKMGILADLYALGEIAYVGGGFRRGGLHAVIEPAAFGVPVIVGPHYSSSPDAELLVEAGGAAALSSQTPEESLTHSWLTWLRQSDTRVDVGLRARGGLQQGAAERTASVLLRFL